jgi:hypothetical protein
MTNEDNWLLDRYRASVENLPPSDLDQAIISAACRQSAARRRVRRARISWVAAAFVTIAVSIVLRSHQFGAAQSRATLYGKSEGIARSYLLNTAIPDYSAAGIAEGAP